MTSFLSNLNARQKRSLCAFFFTFFIGVSFIFIAFVTLPETERAKVLRTNLNYSLFYPVFLSFAAGILVYSIDPAHLKKVGFGWIAFSIAMFAFVAIMIIKDGLAKGPPIQPEMLKASDYHPLFAIQDEARLLRTNAMERTSYYVTNMAAAIRVRPEEIMRFQSFEDFRRRASKLAWADLVGGAWGGLIDVAFFSYLLFTFFKKLDILAPNRDRLLLSFLLLMFWFPLRLITLWHQNFYSLQSIGGVLPFLAFVAAGGLMLMIIMYRPGRLIAILGGIQAVATIIFTIGAKANADFFQAFGKLIADLDLLYFIGIQVAAFLTFGAIAFQFLDAPFEAEEGAQPPPNLQI